MRRRRPLTRRLRVGDRVWIELGAVLGSHGWEAPRCDLVDVLSAKDSEHDRYRQVLRFQHPGSYTCLTTRDCVRVVSVA